MKELDEVKALADRYNIDEHDEAGEWKLGDQNKLF